MNCNLSPWKKHYWGFKMTRIIIYFPKDFQILSHTLNIFQAVSRIIEIFSNWDRFLKLLSWKHLSKKCSSEALKHLLGNTETNIFVFCPNISPWSQQYCGITVTAHLSKVILKSHFWIFYIDGWTFALEYFSKALDAAFQTHLFESCNEHVISYHYDKIFDSQIHILNYWSSRSCLSKIGVSW